MPLWKDHPPRMVWALSPRPSFTGGKTDKAQYGWFWWSRDHREHSELRPLPWHTGVASRKQYQFEKAPKRWQIDPMEAREIVAGLGIPAAARVAVLDGARDTLFEATRSVAADVGDLDGALPIGAWDWVVGAPPIRGLHELLPMALAHVAPEGSLVLLLP